MSTHKNIDKICCIIMVFTIIITIAFCNGSSLGIEVSGKTFGYESRLFDTSYVHTIDIVMDDWDEFIDGCEDEEYTSCAVIIDNEAYKNVGIRAKGNTSLSSVSAYGNDRYSFKIEFDHYDSAKSYYGLDKLSLNNIIQDNTYMKDYLVYQMMGYFGVDSPLCSYVYITVNGEDFGLYLAVEGVEESFLSRNYGSDYGELYKPDTTQTQVGGDGEMPDIRNGGEPQDMENGGEVSDGEMPDMENAGEMPDMENAGEMPDMSNAGEPPDGTEMSDRREDENGMQGGSSSEDVSLIYSDDDYDSYSNIFDNAKTNISDDDKDRLIESLKKLNENENIEDVVDVDEVIRYFVVHNFVCNFDSYTGSMIHNYYLYEEDGKMSMIPWDYNLAFGGFSAGGGQGDGSNGNATELVNYPIDTPVSGGTVDSRPMLAWIFENEEYTEQYHEYFSEFITECFDSGYIEELVQSTAEMISPYVEKDPTKFCTYDEYETGVETLLEFLELRASSVSGQLSGTIPSTSEGQQSDSSTLVDASDINISDMGSMGNMGDGKAPDMQNMPDGGMSGEERPEMPDGGMSGEERPEMPDGVMPDGERPEMPDGSMPDGNRPEAMDGETLD